MKFENSLDLYVNMALKGEVPDLFKNIDYRNLEIIFILVIKNRKKNGWKCERCYGDGSTFGDEDKQNMEV